MIFKNKKTKLRTIVICMFIAALAAVCFAKKATQLHIYLPREITIARSDLKLGDIGILSGEEELVTKAFALELGRLSVPGQQIVLDRPMLLSRLASNGIPAWRINFTGAEKIIVKGKTKVINAEEFIESALVLAKKHLPANSVCPSKPMKLPKELVINGEFDNIRLKGRMVKASAKNQIKAQIDVISGDKVIATRQVGFILKYKCRRAVAKTDIERGAKITPENIKVEEFISNRPESSQWSPPYGLVARRRMSADMVIYPSMLGSATPAIVIRRNENVIIKIEKPWLSITANGKAKQDGRAGEFIKVQNTDSGRIIFAKVKEDGTVEPAF